MNVQLRIATINLCDESPFDKNIVLQKTTIFLLNLNIDILFLQEISNYDIHFFSNELNMKLLNINDVDETCVLINPNKITIVDNYHISLKDIIIYVSCLHLNDVPSISHNMNNILYESSETTPLTFTMEQLLCLCEERRGKIIRKEIKDINDNIVIIGGDFNEPSHLDLDNIQTPVSYEFLKNGFIDTYHYINKSLSQNNDLFGYTWPTGNMYENEPNQRIDFIYTKNVDKIVNSFVYDNENDDWLSDHKMVITDIEI